METRRIRELRLEFQSAFPVKNAEQEAEPDKEAKDQKVWATNESTCFETV